MKKIFWGLIFLFFDFYIAIGSCKISFMPVFVGYLLIFGGADQMKTVCGDFEKIKTPALAMVVWSAIIWFMELLGVYFDMPLVFIIMLVGYCGSAYTLYLLTKATINLDKDYCERSLDAVNLFTYYIVYIVAAAFSFTVFVSEVLAIISMVIGVVFGIVYTVKFYKIRMAYEAIDALPDYDNNEEFDGQEL